MMDDGVSVLFRFLEPMMFRSPGEFDPYVRGTHSRAVSMLMPSPSTVSGVIATYSLSRRASTAEISYSVANWDRAYFDVIGAGTVVRGPLVKVRDELYAEYQDKDLRGFLKLENVRKRCEEISAPQRGLSSLERVDLEFDSSGRAGLMLETRSSPAAKYAKEGFLYGVEYVDYSSSRGRYVGGVAVVVDVFGEGCMDLSSVRNVAVRLGGEGRVASMTTHHNALILKSLAEKVWKGEKSHRGRLALYAATPVLFKGGKPVQQLVHEWSGGKGYRFLGLAGRSTIVGAGYVLGLGRRKPVYSALAPGSVILVEGGFDLLRVYFDGLGEACGIGFGTVIPVPLS